MRHSFAALKGLVAALCSPAMAAFTLLIIGWQIISVVAEVPDYVLPSPLRIVQALSEQSIGVWFEHSVQTLRIALLGFAISFGLSLIIAVLMVQFGLVRKALYPLLVVIQSTPIVAIAPLIIVTLGTEDAPRILITCLITFFPMVVATTTGMLATPPELVELSRSLDAPRFREYTQIRLPSAVPHIFSGLRVSITLAIIGAVVAEFVAAETGLGYFIQFSTSFFAVPQAFAGLFLLILISLCLFQSVVLIQKLFFPWSLHEQTS